MYVLSLDTDSESTLIIVWGNVGAEIKHKPLQYF